MHFTRLYTSKSESMYFSATLVVLLIDVSCTSDRWFIADNFIIIPIGWFYFISWIHFYYFSLHFMCLANINCVPLPSLMCTSQSTKLNVLMRLKITPNLRNQTVVLPFINMCTSRSHICVLPCWCFLSLHVGFALPETEHLYFSLPPCVLPAFADDFIYFLTLHEGSTLAETKPFNFSKLICVFPAGFFSRWSSYFSDTFTSRC